MQQISVSFSANLIWSYIMLGFTNDFMSTYQQPVPKEN